MQAVRTPGLTSIVVVSADSGPLLDVCIDSALTSDTSIEVVLVDNGSTDGAADRAEARFLDHQRFRVLRNGANLGFGPACNRGAAIAGGDLLLFLNPDCRLAESTVSRLRACLESDARIGLLGARVLDANGAPARGNRRRDPTLRRVLATTLRLDRWQTHWSGLAGVEMPMDVGEGPPVELVEAVSGACMMLPRAAFDRVEGFDEGYFLHVEDLDLCRRVRDAGLHVAIANEVQVVHVQGSSSSHRPFFVARHKWRGMWRYFLKFDPAARNPLLRVVTRMALCMYAIGGCVGILAKSVRGKLVGSRDC